jgi:serine/threonine protein kinase
MTVIPATDDFGHYEIEQLLGRGAMGVVYAARDRRIGRRVALKTIQLSPGRFSDETEAKEFFARLQREAEVCGSLLHPNIVTMYEAGYASDGRISYLAMELVDGESLFDLLKRTKPAPLPVGDALRIAEEVLRALEHAHTKSIIHRDIKPANILIAGDGTAKLADFGIARPEDSDLTDAGALLGTPNYMPPEQVMGKKLTTQADVFSLGVVLYEMLTGTKPFAGSQISVVLHNIIQTEVPDAATVRKSVPREVSELVSRMIAKKSEDRPSTSQALHEVTRLRSGRPASAGGPADALNDDVTTISQRGLVFPNPLEPATDPGKDSASLPPGRSYRRAGTLLVTGVLAIALIMGLGLLKANKDGAATVIIPDAQRREFVAKRAALDAAGSAFAAGHYEESLQQYDEYLKNYPDSVAAREGRQRVIDARAQQQSAVSKAPAPEPRHSPKKESGSLLSRLKRVFHH